MTRKLQTSALLALVILIAACGGTPTGPITEPPIGGNITAVTLTFVSGETNAPVVGATVKVNGTSLTTNGSGQITIDPLTQGTVMTITAGGYLERVTKYRGDNKFTLVSLADGFAPDYIEELMYKEAFAPNAPRPLERLNTSVVSLVPSTGVAGDSEAEATIAAVAAGANAFSSRNGLGIQFRVTTADAATGTVVDFQVDPALTTSAGTIKRKTGHVINRATIKVREIRWARLYKMMLHEIGHVMGLAHSLLPNDLMYATTTATQDWSNLEDRAIRLTYQRLPGNRFPDDDSGL